MSTKPSKVEKSDTYFFTDYHHGSSMVPPKLKELLKKTTPAQRSNKGPRLKDLLKKPIIAAA